MVQSTFLLKKTPEPCHPLSGHPLPRNKHQGGQKRAGHEEGRLTAEAGGQGLRRKGSKLEFGACPHQQKSSWEQHAIWEERRLAALPAPRMHRLRDASSEAFRGSRWSSPGPPHRPGARGRRLKERSGSPGQRRELVIPRSGPASSHYAQTKHSRRGERRCVLAGARCQWGD